jgi:hypothetical protein
MRLRTELAIQKEIEARPAGAWSRKDFEVLLRERREMWGAPQSLTTSNLINFLLDNEIVRVAEIRSKTYGDKKRYMVGQPSPLQFSLSFFKNSYLSHASALSVHGLGTSDMIYVNREQTPKNTTSRLSQGRIDLAFKNEPRRSAFEFNNGSFKVTFLNGKNTGNAGVIGILGPSGEAIQVTSLERTLIDCVVRPQYAGGIRAVAEAYRTAGNRVAVETLTLLLKKTKYVYPYHQAIGFLLERAGREQAELEPLRALGIRFKFYLDYGIKAPDYNEAWKVNYPKVL